MRSVVVGLAALLLAIGCMIGAFWLASFTEIGALVLMVIGIVAALISRRQRQVFVKLQ